MGGPTMLVNKNPNKYRWFSILPKQDKGFFSSYFSRLIFDNIR